jgi:hypothetical protein
MVGRLCRLGVHVPSIISFSKLLWQVFPQESELLRTDTNLKLACLQARSPLAIAALPSVSPIPSAPLTNPHELTRAK